MPAKAAVDQTGRFQAALDKLVAQIRRDHSVLAAVLCGSLSHDRVWSKSDIDLLLITVDDRKTARTGISLYADGVNVHALLMPRAEFRKASEGVMRQSFVHSFIAKGRLLYTHDPAIAAMCDQLRKIGERDTEVQLFAAATHVLGPLYKAHKFLKTRAAVDGGLEYTALWILHTANALARLELIAARRLAGRENLPEALELNPALFQTIYLDVLNSRKTRKTVEAAIAAIDQYLRDRASTFFAPLIEYLREVGDTRTASDIENHFERNFGIEGATAACEYLADIGILEKAAAPAQITKLSNVSVEELALFYAEEVPDEW